MDSGEFNVIDESYNVNLVFMWVVLVVFGEMLIKWLGWCIVVIGDMCEFGFDGDWLYVELVGFIMDVEIDVVYCVGLFMKVLW